MSTVTASRMTTTERLVEEAQNGAAKAGRVGGALLRQPRLMAVVGIGGLALLSAEGAFAGTGGSGEFDEIWDTLEEWVQGTLGRIIALTLIIVGAAMGVVRQSLITFVVGIAMGLALYNAPTVIDNIMTGTLGGAGTTIQADAPANGLAQNMSATDGEATLFSRFNSDGTFNPL